MTISIHQTDKKKDNKKLLSAYNQFLINLTQLTMTH